MFNIRQLTTGAVLVITLPIAAASTQALMAAHLESIPSRYLTGNLQQNSQHPDSVPHKYRADATKLNAPPHAVSYQQAEFKDAQQKVECLEIYRVTQMGLNHGLNPLSLPVQFLSLL